MEGMRKLYVTNILGDLSRWRTLCTVQMSKTGPIEEGVAMRVVIVGLLSVGLAASACDKGQSAAAAAAPVVSAASAGTAGSGASEASRAAAREVTIPAGTQLPITLDTTIGSDISRIEQPVAAHLTRPVVIHGDTVLPAGSRVSGVVTDATRSGRVKGRAHVALRFDAITPGGAAGEGTRYRMETTAVGRTAAAQKKRDAMEIGGATAGGALIGAIAGGKKGALIGGAVGGGAGTGVVLSQRGKEVRLPKGTPLTLKLSEPLTVKVRG
jgi:hypothetical protein